MAGDKKGKSKQLVQKKKRTCEDRERERAEAVADAADRQGSLRIRDLQTQGEPQQQLCRSGRTCQSETAHWICWILAQLSQNAHMDELAQSRMYFSFYSPTTPRDDRHGPRGQRRAQRTLDERGLAEGRVMDDPTAAEDASLAMAEAQLPHYLDTDTEDSEDDEEYIPTVTVP